MDITKQELIDQLRTEYGYTKDSARNLVNDFVNVIIENIQKGNSVTIKGFGCFDLLERAQRSCPHPRDREQIVVIPPHWIPRFYAGKDLKRAVKIYEDNMNRSLDNG